MEPRSLWVSDLLRATFDLWPRSCSLTTPSPNRHALHLKRKVLIADRVRGMSPNPQLEIVRAENNASTHLDSSVGRSVRSLHQWNGGITYQTTPAPPPPLHLVSAINTTTNTVDSKVGYSLLNQQPTVIASDTLDLIHPLFSRKVKHFDRGLHSFSFF